MTAEPFDPHCAAESDLQAWCRIKAALDRETYPDEDPKPLAAIRTTLTGLDYGWPEHRWVVRDEAGQVIGGCTTSWRDADDNLDLVFLDVELLSSARGGRVEAQLIAAAGAHARAAGRTLVTAEGKVGSAWAAFLESNGAERKTLDRRSLLDVSSVDLDDLRAWGQPTPDAQQRYSLVQWRDVTPEDLLAQHADMRTAMNDAPRENLALEDMHYAPEQIRRFETACVSRGEGLLVTCARDDESGALVALTDFITPSTWPERAIQEDTVVLREHRGHGLGRWVKVANLIQLLDARPSTTSIQTFNAEVNRHMLDINERMGFRPAGEFAEWQVDLDVLERSLGI